MAKVFDDTQAIAVTCRTLNDLFMLGDSECVSMYLKYAYHSKIQKTNTVYATVQFMAKGLNWGRDKTRATKKKLTNLGFIEDKIDKDEEGNTKWYVHIKGLLTKAKTEKSFGEYPTEMQEGTYPTEKVQGGKPVDKCLNDDEIKCLKDDDKRENDSALEKTQLNNVDNTTGLKANLRPEISKLPHIEQVDLDIKNTVFKLRDLALKKAKQNNEGLHGSEGSELVKTLTKKIKSLMKAGDNLENAEIALSNAIRKYYDYWIKDDNDGLRRKNFGLVKSLETQWKALTS